MNKEHDEWGKLPEKLHEWYLEACLRPESGFDFNPAAQEPYELLPEGSKFLDKYIAEKIRTDFIPKSEVDRVLEKMKKFMDPKSTSTSFVSYYNQALEDIRRELLGDK